MAEPPAARPNPCTADFGPGPADHCCGECVHLAAARVSSLERTVYFCTQTISEYTLLGDEPGEPAKDILVVEQRRLLAPTCSRFRFVLAPAPSPTTR